MLAGAEQVGSVGGLNTTLRKKKQQMRRKSLQSASHPDEKVSKCVRVVKWKIRRQTRGTAHCWFDQDPRNSAESGWKDDCEVCARTASERSSSRGIRDRTHERMDFQCRSIVLLHIRFIMTDQTNVPAHIPNAFDSARLMTSGIDHYDVI